MATRVIDAFGERVRDAVVIAPKGAAIGPFGIEAGHPTPDAGSEAGGRRALALARELRDDEELLVLLSGGASALMAVPAAGLTLGHKRDVTDGLLRAGADIHALNTVRKHLSDIKGGRLAAAAAGPVRTLAISDVVGDDAGVIGSGPTFPDASTYADALEVLRRFGGWSSHPRPVVAHLERGRNGTIPETPKPGDPRLARCSYVLVGSRRDAMRGAADAAASAGYHVVEIERPLTGEVPHAAIEYSRRVRKLAAGRPRPLCVVSSGETTVRVRGTGRGGRNQELALTLAALLPTLPGVSAMASVGTDGIDGPTDAAGALVDIATADRARTAGLNPDEYLNNNDAYSFFAALGDLVHTGPTGTNVGDLQVILLA
jgi:hydroxypyruvate reductase